MSIVLKALQAAAGILHCLLIKIFHIRQFAFKFGTLIPLSTEIVFAGGGTISCGRIRTRRRCRISVAEQGCIKIGDNVFFNVGCIIAAHNSVTIGEDTSFGPGVKVFDHDHDYSDLYGLKNGIYRTTPVQIGKNVWIGADTVILRGTEIGDNCVVGAGCVLKGKYPDNSIILQKRETSVKTIER